MTDDNVVKFIPRSRFTYGEIPPDQVLDAAKGKLDQVLILGYTPENDEYFASSFGQGETALWLMERAKHFLMNMNNNPDEG